MILHALLAVSMLNSLLVITIATSSYNKQDFSSLFLVKLEECLSLRQQIAKIIKRSKVRS